MSKYVALLRGINVGGNHSVPKLVLRETFEKAGFQNVITYINSGNVVFESDIKPEANEIQVLLEKQFGFTIPTLVVSGKKIQRIAAAIPKDWTNDSPKPDKSGQKSDVLYLFEDINTPDILEKIGYDSKLETMLYIDGAVLANITRLNQSRSSLLKVVGSSL